MNKALHLKTFTYLFHILSFIASTITAFGQNCRFVSVRKDKELGIITASGIVSSNDFYSLLIQKQRIYDDTLASPYYVLFLNAASRVQFSDSTLKTKGTFHLKLLDSSTLSVEGVSFINRPLGFHSVGFRVYIDEEVVQTLAANPIVSLMVDDKLRTDFKAKAQKQQRQIFSCLLQKALRP